MAVDLVHLGVRILHNHGVVTLTLPGSASYVLFNVAATMIKMLGSNADDRTILVTQLSVLSK